MNAEALRPDPLPFNPDVIRWAREWRGRSLEEAAKKVNVDEEKVRAWEKGAAVPTVRQARILASFYDRSFLEFFLSRLPKVKETKLAPDFRLHRTAPDPRGDRELQAIQDWAEETRNNALELFATSGDGVPAIPAEFRANLYSNPDRSAREARRLCGYAIEDQIALGSAERGRVAKDIRRAIESLGILVLKDSRLGKYGVRGLTLATDPLPVIIFGTEAPTAQAFTLAHELGHIALQQSAISGHPTARLAQTEAERSERWCDEFAGAFLVPADALGKIWVKPNQPNPQIGDDALRQIANTFSVSQHAMLIRLTQLHYVAEEYYWERKRPEFLQQESEFKGGGIPAYYGTRFRNTYGDTYTSLVLDAWGNNRITNHNAAELMGINNLSHLVDIRDNFFA
jgi:Zn-dependent peptidase ImmA (M78 family)/DNA-binding XRE family transcriptional regulator